MHLRNKKEREVDLAKKIFQSDMAQSPDKNSHKLIRVELVNR